MMTSGNGVDVAINHDLHAGWRFTLGDGRISLEPVLTVGNVLGMVREAHYWWWSPYAAIGLGLGIIF